MRIHGTHFAGIQIDEIGLDGMESGMRPGWHLVPVSIKIVAHESASTQMKTRRIRIRKAWGFDGKEMAVAEWNKKRSSSSSSTFVSVWEQKIRQKLCFDKHEIPSTLVIIFFASACFPSISIFLLEYQ
jgi:hypothetical protein